MQTQPSAPSRNRNLIFIVAYNHEKFIESVVARIPESVLSDSGNEILVIDDASRDRTFFVTDHLRSKLQGRVRLTVMKNPVNQGYGGNQKLGYRYAIDHGFERVLLVHGDGQYAPELLDRLIAEYETQPSPDAVFGTRMADWRSPLKGGMPLYKFVGNKILTFLQNRMLRSRMSEFHSGYRTYSTALLRRIPFEANSNDFHFDTEIIIQCLAAGARVVEIPIPTHYGEEVCHVNGMRYALNVIGASLHYRVHGMGFLYDRKFDVGQPAAVERLGPHTSHAKIVAMVKPFARVLEVGCGSGSISRRLIEKGCVVDGVGDLPREEVRAALRHYWRMDLARDPEALRPVLERNEYDTVLLPNSLEQLAEPEKLLDLIRVARKARPRPLVLASASNVAFCIVRGMLALGEFNYGARGILAKNHARLFTRRAFRHLFEQSSYVVKAEHGAVMPFSGIFRARSWLVRALEATNAFLARLLPGQFSYELLLAAEPLPTANQILEVCVEHSEELRTAGEPAQDAASGEPRVVPLKGTS